MTNLEIVKELYRSFSTKDYESFPSICPELEWIQNPGFPKVSGIKLKAANDLSAK